jgi:antitoxin (DNA-binding transcriptional repressor) of toxin-antitoxin stability system
MIRIFSVEQAQKKLGEILTLVQDGERVQISIGDVPVVELVLISQPKKRPLFGEFEPFDYEITPELLAPLHTQEEWEEILAESDREFLRFLSELREEKDSKP